MLAVGTSAIIRKNVSKVLLGSLPDVLQSLFTAGSRGLWLPSIRLCRSIVVELSGFCGAGSVHSLGGARGRHAGSGKFVSHLESCVKMLL